jgi:hypothetical protein
MEVHLAHSEKPLTARGTVDLPFGGLGLSLEACERHAETLRVQVIAWTPDSFRDGMPRHEPPAALSGYRLLTVLGCEIRGR